MKILIVGNHPVMGDFYEKKLNEFYLSHTIQIHNVSNFNSTSTLVSNVYFEIALIDHSILTSDDFLISGIDIALLISQKLPHCKIIFITGITKILPIYEIIKRVRPDCMITHAELNPNIFYKCLLSNERGEIYYSDL